MSDLLLMAQQGLPRNGLVLLADPYRDTYGRNVLASGRNTIAGMLLTNLTPNDDGVLETTTNNVHRAEMVQISDALTCVIAFKAKANGRNIIRVWRSNWGDCVDVDLLAGTANGTAGCLLSIEQDEDGVCSVVLTFPAFAFGNGVRQILVSLYDGESLASMGNSSYAGDTSKGVDLWDCQLNLGSQLFPYSTPAGAPGTLQAMADYCGGLYPLQLGSGATGDASDPAFTGVAMVHAADYLISGNLAGITMAGDWTLPFLCKPSGTANVLVSLASAAAADQYQAVEFNGSTKVRIHTVNGATSTYSDDLTVSATTVQLLILTSSGDTLTLKRMDTGTSVTATNADPTGSPRLCVGALGVNTVASPADAMEWHYLPLYGRAWGASEQARYYRWLKSDQARKGVTVA